jgi:hypothetical protein
LKDVCAFRQIVEDYRDLRRLHLPFAAFFNDLALLFDDLSELVHRKDLENERFLFLIGKLLDEFDEGFVLLVEARCRGEEEDALK